MALTPQQLDRLVKLLGMLGSNFEGERANAGKLADDLVRGAGMTWDKLLRNGHAYEPKPARKPYSPPPHYYSGSGWRDWADDLHKQQQQYEEKQRREQEQRRSGDRVTNWREAAMKCQQYNDRIPVLTDWEKRFLLSILSPDRKVLTLEQDQTLERICIKCNVNWRAAT